MSSTPTAPASLLLSEATQQLHAFFHHLDERRYDAMLALFAPDARWLRQGRWLEGRAAILTALEARPATQRVRHVISNTYIAAASGAEVDVEAYMTAYRYDGPLDGVPRLPGPFRLNLVSTRFRIDDAGRWLIAEQRLVPEFDFFTSN